MKWMGTLPLLGYITTQGLFEKALGAAKRNRYDNIYTRIGVKPIINARGRGPISAAPSNCPR
jgi:hypothetical protein